MTRVWRVLVALGWGCGLLGSCSGRSAPGGAASEPVSEPVTLPIEVLADTGRADVGGLGSGAVVGARAWLARVGEAPVAGTGSSGTPAPVGAAPGSAPNTVPRPSVIDVPLPSAAPDTVLPEWPSPPVLVIPVGLEPPVLRESAPLRIPRGRRGQASVELELRVDERGAVSEVRWAGGSSDPALVAAAIECARSMRFAPARRGGEAVAVWCGQRFDFM